MFDNIKLGQYIQFLRKSAGLTQSRLAESLGVSHQAVSNWERGESMPDIALLSMIARTLGTTVDRMLAAAEDFDRKTYEAKALAEPEPDTEEEAADAEEKTADAPQNAEEIYEEPEAEPESEVIEEKDSELFPDLNAVFINMRDSVRTAVTNAMKSFDGIRGAAAVFADIKEDIEDAIEDAADEIEELEEDLKDVKNKRRAVEIHISTAAESDEWNEIVSLAPFASQEALDKLVDKLDISSGGKKLSALAPFLSEETLIKIIRKSLDLDAHGSDKLLVTLAPHLSSSVLDKLVLDSGRQFDRKTISRLAPFLSTEAVDMLLTR